MRVVVAIAASVLVAACSSTEPNGSGRSEQAPTTSSRTAAPTTTKTTTPVPTAAPAAGTPIADVIRWIEAGKPADVAHYHSAVRDGVTTQLDSDVAFVSPSGKTNCMTDTRFGGALACLVDLSDPPPQPADVYGQWKGGWVDFEGPSVEVGSAHGDPGRFGNGTGPELPYGQTLAFGDYRCRADQTGTFCVNYAHQSAVRFADSGVETFGCLTPVTPPPSDVGKKFSC
jgi:hypothetical protein